MEGGETERNALNTRDFSKVIITLENVLLPDEKRSPTPSILDGLDSDTETDLRILGCELIQTSGILLKLPQVDCTFIFWLNETQILFNRRLHDLHILEFISHIDVSFVIILHTGSNGHRTSNISEILFL